MLNNKEERLLAAFFYGSEDLFWRNCGAFEAKKILFGFYEAVDYLYPENVV